MSSKRVVVTGLGTTSPVGGDVPTTWAALLAGTSGVVVLTEDWAEQLPVRIAARVAVEPLEVMERVKARRLDRSGQFALIAALEAWNDSGLGEGSVDPERLGVAMASGIGGVTTLLSNYDTLLEKGPRRVSPLSIPMLMPNSPAANVGLAIGAKAGVHTPVSACASGNEAIAHGIDMIRLGRADVVVVGGTEAADPSAADGGLRQHDGAVQAQRRPRARVASLGRRPRRLRPRRGRRRPRDRERRARRSSRRQGVRRSGRCRRHCRLPRHRPTRPRGARRDPRDEAGTSRRRPGTPETSSTSTRMRPRRHKATWPNAWRSPTPSTVRSTR